MWPYVYIYIIIYFLFIYIYVYISLKLQLHNPSNNALTIHCQPVHPSFSTHPTPSTDLTQQPTQPPAPKHDTSQTPGGTDDEGGKVS